MIVTIVNIVVKAENVDQFIEATIENHQNSIKEKGNLRFDILQHRDNPAAFTLYEAYESDEEAAAHRKTAHYCETQISKTKCIEICKSNNPAISGGYNTPPLGAELGSRACPGVHTRDLKWRDAVESWMAKPREGFAHNVVAPLEESAWKR